MRANLKCTIRHRSKDVAFRVYDARAQMMRPSALRSPPRSKRLPSPNPPPIPEEANRGPCVQLQPAHKFSWETTTKTSIAVLLSVSLALAPPVFAGTDAARVGTCVLRNCQIALAQCLGDAACVQNLVCLQACNGAEDETACQIRCGDRYADKAVDVFNTCAVSEKKCVPQKVDDGLFPVPPDCSLDENFNLASFQGRWYITAGLNPLFDTFPCQEHYFATPKGSSGVVYAEINWRIPVSDGDFIQRSTMQRFVQDEKNPALLYNHDNEYLHYQDDWYILGSKFENADDDYVFIYYKGENDAWKGYGGATVYTRSSVLPESIIPTLKVAAERAGLDWDKFQKTDNTCPAKLVRKGPFEELEDDIVQAEKFAEQRFGAFESVLEPSLRSFGRGFTVIEQNVVKGFEQQEAQVEAELEREKEEAARLIRRFTAEAKMGRWVQFIPLPLREIIMPMP
jgi:violaxanthin de-epoxidase